MKPLLVVADWELNPGDDDLARYKDFMIPHTKAGQDWYKCYQSGKGATLACSENGWTDVYTSRKLQGMETTLDGMTGVLLRRCKLVDVSQIANLFMEYTENMRACNEQISEYIDTRDLQKLIGWHEKIKVIKDALSRMSFPLAPDLTLYMVALESNTKCSNVVQAFPTRKVSESSMPNRPEDIPANIPDDIPADIPAYPDMTGPE
jgi:hypothetical protein